MKSPNRLLPFRPALAVFLLLLSVAGCGDDEVVPDSGTLSYRFRDEISSPAPGAFQGTARLAVDPGTGALFVVDSFSGAIYRVNESGSSRVRIARAHSWGLVARDGLVYAVVDGGLGIFNADGKSLGVRRFHDGDATVRIDWISGSAPAGLLLVRSEERTGLFDLRGNLLQWLPRPEQDNSDLAGVVVTQSGLIARLNAVAHRIEVIDFDGDVHGSWTVENTGSKIALTPDGLIGLYVTDVNSRIEVFDTTGHRLQSTSIVGVPGFSPDQFVIGGNGIAAFYHENRGVTITRDGIAVGSFGHRAGTAEGEVRWELVAGRPDGGVVGIDSEHHVHNWSANGTDVGTFSSSARHVFDVAFDRTFVGHFVQLTQSILGQRIVRTLPDGSPVEFVDLASLPGIEGPVQPARLALDSSGREIVVARDETGHFIVRLAPEQLPVTRFATVVDPAWPFPHDSIERVIPFADGGFAAIGNTGIYRFDYRLELVGVLPIRRLKTVLGHALLPRLVIPDRDGLGLLVIGRGSRFFRIDHVTRDGELLGEVPIDLEGVEDFDPATVEWAQVNDAGELIVLLGQSRILRFQPAE